MFNRLGRVDNTGELVMLLELLARWNARLGKWLFDRNGSDYRDLNTSTSYQSEATGRLGLGMIQYLAEYEEVETHRVTSRATELRLGQLAVAVSTEVGIDTPFFGSWVTVMVWKLGLILDFGQKTRLGFVTLV